MPLIPYHAKTAVLTKSPRQGNNDTFSGGKDAVGITAWEVWNTRVKTRTSVVSKIYSDETRAIYRTYDRHAAELEGDDGFTFDGYTYSVQSVAEIKSTLNMTLMLYEVSVK